MNNIPFLKRLGWFLGVYEFTNEEQEFAFPTEKEALDGDIQVMIATEEALVAAMQMIVFQKEAWNDLCDALEERGVNVEMPHDAQVEYAALLLRMQAALTVAKQNLNITDDILKGIA